MLKFRPSRLGVVAEFLKLSHSKTRCQKIYRGLAEEVAKAGLLPSGHHMYRAYKINKEKLIGKISLEKHSVKYCHVSLFSFSLVEWFKKTTWTSVPSEIWRLQGLEWNWAHRLPLGQSKKRGYYGSEPHSHEWSGEVGGGVWGVQRYKIYWESHVIFNHIRLNALFL